MGVGEGKRRKRGYCESRRNSLRFRMELGRMVINKIRGLNNVQILC